MDAATPHSADVPTPFRPIQEAELRPGSVYAVGLREPVTSAVWESLREYLGQMGKPHGITFLLFPEVVTLLDPRELTK